MSAQDRRKQILTAARRCFIAQGYDGSRMSDIAAEAGISKGGVYFHFSGKEEIFSALVDEEFDRSIGFLRDVTMTSASAAEKLGHLAAFYFAEFTQDQDVPRFMVVIGEMAIRNEDVRVRMLNMHVRFLDELTALLQQGIDEGDLRQTDARAAAILLKGLMDGVEGAMALGFEIDDVPGIITAGIDIILNGLGSEQGTS